MGNRGKSVADHQRVLPVEVYFAVAYVVQITDKCVLAIVVLKLCSA